MECPKPVTYDGTEELLSAVRSREVRPAIIPTHNIVNPVFHAELGRRLQAWHDAEGDDCLDGDRSERRFREAAHAAGHTILNGTPGGSWDFQVNDERIQLKTEASGTINEDRAHISSYTRIGSVVWADDSETLVRLKETYLESLLGWDRLLLLRRFGRGPFFYELLEVPKTVLLQAGQVDPRFTGNILPRSAVLDTADLRISFQSSVRKISLSVNRAVCVPHGTGWVISADDVLSTREVDQPVQPGLPETHEEDG